MRRAASARSSALSGSLAAIALILIAAAPAPPPSPAPQHPEPAPQTSASPAVSIPDGNSVLAMLDAVIGWYRGGALEDQLVQEPAEVLFASEDRLRADEVLKLAFQYARAEAAALAGLHQGGIKHPPASQSTDLLAHPGALQSRRAQIESDVARLKDQVRQLEAQLAAAPRRKRDQLSLDLSAAQNQLELAQSRADLLATLSRFETGESGSRGGAGALSGQIDELERTVPQAAAAEQPSAAATAVIPKPAAEPSGLIERAKAWFAMRQKVDLIGRRIRSTDDLNTAVSDAQNLVRAGLVKIDGDARALAGKGAIEAGASSSTIEARKTQFEGLIAAHKLVGDALVPLRRMSLLLARHRSNLLGWQDDAARRADADLDAVVMSAVGLAVVLGLLIAVAMVWRRIAYRYVEDARRRAQMLQFRNFVIGLLIVIVLAFEFVSEAGSLATVIGLGTAGIAVALQDVILSVAGYFRIGGRFGINVGDWLELQGVRGEVIDIGLTKLTMMELGGSGAGREPTGRLVVLPNSVVFREKFTNRAYGTSLGWDEIELTVSPDCDYRAAEKRLVEVVDEVFAHYRDAARGESREMERRYNLKIEPPRPQSRLRVSSDAIRLSVRYPVDARMAPQVADEISRRLLDSIKRDPAIRLVPSTQPILQPGPDHSSPDEAPKPREEPPATRAPLRKA